MPLLLSDSLLRKKFSWAVCFSLIEYHIARTCDLQTGTAPSQWSKNASSRLDVSLSSIAWYARTLGVGLSLHYYLFTFDEARLTPGSHWWNRTWPIDLWHRFLEQLIDGKMCACSDHCNHPQTIKENSHFHFQIWYSRTGSSMMSVRKKQYKRIAKHQRTCWPWESTGVDSINRNYCAHSGPGPTASWAEALYWQPAAAVPLSSHT